MRAPTSKLATGSPHTVAAQNGIANAQLLEQDPVLASNPQFGQEGVILRVPSSEGSDKETLRKHLKSLLFKTVLSRPSIFQHCVS